MLGTIAATSNVATSSVALGDLIMSGAVILLGCTTCWYYTVAMDYVHRVSRLTKSLSEAKADLAKQDFNISYTHKRFYSLEDRLNRLHAAHSASLESYAVLQVKYNDTLIGLDRMEQETEMWKVKYIELYNRNYLKNEESKGE